MSLTGDPDGEPIKVGVPIGDLLAGHVRRVRRAVPRCTSATSTGRGQVVRTSLLSSIVGVHAYQGTRWTIAGEVPGAIGNHHPSIAPYGLFATADAAVQVACGSEGLWRSFAPLVGLDPAEPRFATNTDRVDRRDELHGADRGRRSTTARVGALARAARRGGRPGRQGAHDRRRLHLGADPVAGPGHRGRRIRCSARSSCPGRRCGSVTGRMPAGGSSTTRRRGWVSTTRRSAHGWMNATRPTD